MKCLKEKSGSFHDTFFCCYKYKASTLIHHVMNEQPSSIFFFFVILINHQSISSCLILFNKNFIYFFFLLIPIFFRVSFSFNIHLTSPLVSFVHHFATSIYFPCRRCVLYKNENFIKQLCLLIKMMSHLMIYVNLLEINSLKGK